MRGALIYGPRDVQVADLPDPQIADPNDTIVRVLLAGICGSDLWGYRGYWKYESPARAGHEFVGVVCEAGSAVRTVRPGTIVIAPFLWNDGTCQSCLSGRPTSCTHGGIWGQPGSDGGQGQYVRVPFSDATLVAAPTGADDDLLVKLLPLTDVLGTGYHAAISAGVSTGSSVTIVGDGAVGLCAVLAAKRLGAGQIVALSRYEPRQKTARRFGATDIVSVRGDEAVRYVRDLTGGLGTDCALECVGTSQSWRTAVDVVRDGGQVGFVGVPADVDSWIHPRDLYSRNIGVRGGVAPVRTYMRELLDAVVNDGLDASPVFDLEVPLEHVGEGYSQMDKRRAIKALVRVS